jgi:DNA polymerase-3 subunit gamma/tau
MSYQVLARKWRPKTFDEVVGQDHVIRSLKNAVKNKTVAQAILLTGTRGVGKTSIARIFSKAVRCENLTTEGNPCLKCPSCLDIDNSNSIDYLEIDGASNNSVENIRELIENIHYLPTAGSKKIYVIDEIHMLSLNAFNALLKTLEEPPAHVVFIFATTDPQKIPATVLSRCLRFDLKNVTFEKILERLLYIAKEEGIKFESDDVARKICQFGNGSMRDTLSLMDQVLNYSINKNVSETEIVAAIGLARTEVINLIVGSIFAADISTLNKNFHEIVKEGVDLKIFSSQVLDKLFSITQIAQNIDIVGKELKLTQDLIKNLSISEIFWVYESIAKDLEWSLKSLDPHKTLLLILQKTALRNSLLTNTQVEIKKKVIEAPIKSFEIKDWSEFIKDLYKKFPAIAANLEHGNLLDKIKYLENKLHINLAFAHEHKLFYDFIQGANVMQNLKESMIEFFQVKLGELSLEIKILDRDKEEHKSFRSQIELEQEKQVINENKKRENLLNNPFVQEAEKLFGTKVTKVSVNK